MRAISFAMEDFPDDSFLGGYTILPITTNALMRAVIAAGNNPALKPPDIHAKHDISMRVSVLKSALDLSDKDFLRPSKHFQRSGSTDKGIKSEFIGNALCAHAALFELNIPWLVNVESLGSRYQVHPPLTGQRPDYLGRTFRGDWHVFECKGRSQRSSDTEIAEWKVQAEAIRRVNGKRVVYNIVSNAFIDSRRRQWELLWVDPPADDGSEIRMEENSFFDSYYEEIRNFVRERESLGVFSEHGWLVPVGDTGVFVGLHKEIQQAVWTIKPEAIINFARSHRYTMADLPFEIMMNDGVSIFPDGLLIKHNSELDEESIAKIIKSAGEISVPFKIIESMKTQVSTIDSTILVNADSTFN